ncbi:MAG TPA: HAD-IA family hydrolase [Gemmatimonadales bacterium]
MITHCFFDVGGVLGTNGWDKAERAEAVKKFALEQAEFDRRHHGVVLDFEQGRVPLDGYLDAVVFYRPRGFTKADFTAFMREQSVPWPASIAVARAAAKAGYRVMTLNNESAELNAYRVKHFGLTDFCSAFFCSSTLGTSKPESGIYQLALGVAQVKATRAVFIDDRPENLAPAKALGMETIRFTDPPALEKSFAALGVTI